MTLTSLNRRRARLGRGIWLLVAGLVYGVYIAGLPGYYERALVISPETGAWLESVNLLATFPAFYYITLDSLTLLAFTSVAVVLFWKRGADWLALQVGIMMILTAFIYTGTRYNYLGPVGLGLSAVLIALGETMQVMFFYIFPDGRFIPRAARWGILPLFIWRVYIWANIYTYDLSQGALEVGFVVLLLFTGIGFQIHRYRKLATPLQRQQAKYLLIAAVVTISVVAVYIYVVNITGLVNSSESDFITVASLRLMRQVALFLFPLAIALSILRFRLWNIDLAINRALVYVSVLVGVGLLFAAGFALTQQVLTRTVASEQQTPALIVAALLAGLLFNPIRDRVQHMVDRRLYGFRFDLGELRRAQRIRTITNPGQFSGFQLGDYLLLDALGRGGMSEVYQAQRSGKLFAVKVLLSDLAEDATARARFKREATAMQALDHPHIVKVHDAGDTETLHYIALDYVAGVSLKNLMRDDEPVSLPLVTQIIDDVAAALDYAHSKGLVHRDVKPSNIMLAEQEGGYHPYLMDFGIAKIKDEETDLTGTGAVGTIDYMAPEQIESARTVDHRADIYALGMVVYEMLTGKYPFQGGAASILFSHLQQPVPDPRLVIPTLPASAAEAVLRALAKDPENRFNSAGELALALHLAQV